MIRLQRLLDDYLKTTVWDEKMNRVRERWLWERKGSSTQKEPFSQNSTTE